MHEDLDGDGTEDLLHNLRTGEVTETGGVPQEQAIRQRGAKKPAQAQQAPRGQQKQLSGGQGGQQTREQVLAQLMAMKGGGAAVSSRKRAW